MVVDSSNRLFGFSLVYGEIFIPATPGPHMAQADSTFLDGREGRGIPRKLVRLSFSFGYKRKCGILLDHGNLVGIAGAEQVNVIVDGLNLRAFPEVLLGLGGIPSGGHIPGSPWSGRRIRNVQRIHIQVIILHPRLCSLVCRLQDIRWRVLRAEACGLNKENVDRGGCHHGVEPGVLVFNF